MIPETLDGWTYEIVKALCAAGHSESERHDFKYNLESPKNCTKICCAFANSYGGFIVVGVKEFNGTKFLPLGIAPNTELYGNFLDKIKTNPEIDVKTPKMINVPDSNNVLYVFEIPNSQRKPHLPSVEGERFFWKRNGPSCKQMTMEEIRYQISSYESKISNLYLILADLFTKENALLSQITYDNGKYDGQMFSFELLVQCMVNTNILMKDDPQFFISLDFIIRELNSVNFHKDILKSIITASHYDVFDRRNALKDYKEICNRCYMSCSPHISYIRNIIKTKFDIEFNPRTQSK